MSGKEIKTEEQLTCDECGRFGAMEVADQKLCPECYSNSGACCAGNTCDDDGSIESAKAEA